MLGIEKDEDQIAEMMTIGHKASEDEDSWIIDEDEYTKFIEDEHKVVLGEAEPSSNKTQEWAFIWAKVHAYGARLNMDYYQHFIDTRTMTDRYILGGILVWVVIS